MAYQFREVEDTDTIKSEGYSVRVAVDDGNTLFACKDILTLCGYKCTSDIARKMAANETATGVTKMIGYPVIGEKGMRRIKMYFFNLEAATAVIQRSKISPDVRKWLETAVLTYRKERDVSQAKLSAPTAGEQKPAILDYGKLNLVIDRIMIELMEVKKKLLASVQ